MEKKYVLDEACLKRLANSDPETRVKALHEINLLLKNNIRFSGDSRQTSEDLTVVSLEVLVRNLVRWFQYRPVTHENEVLDLLALIFSRRDFLRHVAKHISISRLKKEVIKIGNVVLSDESFLSLQTINQFLTDYESSVLIDFAHNAGSISEVNSPQHSQMSSASDSTERTQNVAPSPSVSLKTRSKSETEKVAEEEFWEKLDGASLDTFNGIDAELSLHLEETHLINVLGFLRTSVDDYPPEFFLQPPNILEKLADILFAVSKENSQQILKLIRFIIVGLKHRWSESLECTKKLAKKQDETFIAFKKHVNKILLELTNFFERLHDSFCLEIIEQNQNVLNGLYRLLFDLAAFISETQNVCVIFLNDLMNSMGKVTRDLRLRYSTGSTDKGTIRLHYMVHIHIINTLVASTDTANISGDNIWEFECDIALLDVPLKMFHPRISSLIESNRQYVIRDDKELKLLLKSQSSWKPVVKLFQDSEGLSDEAIIYKGLEAINTIRIHRSLEMIDVIMRSIKRCAASFNVNKKLKKAAEEVVLRLISIEVPEIRRHVYAIVHRFVQEKIQDSEEQPADSSLCSAVGFPITTEIVTEVLCFGFNNDDEDIFHQSRIILHALLRSKVVFKNQWQLILNEIKPILPLMTCLDAVDEKMGLYVFDVFHQHSVFDDDELNLAFARFLYCSHPKMRNLAKKKLLGKLQFDNEMIEIVPDDFCVVPMHMVTDLNVPDSQIGFDQEAYNTTHQVLKTMDQSDCSIVQSVLLKLSILMNSRELCEKLHDDNAWVYFMVSPDMGFPDSIVIRKLTINILYKWAVCIPNFRIYLANEPKILNLLIKTLIFFQDEAQIKKEASWLLFLLVFSDFIVTTEGMISMPRILSRINCPFKFEHHWTESPFNKGTALEQLYEVMEVNQGPTDVREITLKCMKFTFALEWFKNETKVLFASNFGSESYYHNRSSKTLKVNEKLQLSQSDITCLKHTCTKQILKTLHSEMDNTTVVQLAQDLIHEIQCLLMIPTDNNREVAQTIDKCIDRLTVYSALESQQKMFMGFVQIYQEIMKSLEDDRIVNVLNKQFFKCVISNINFPVSDEVYIEGLDLINSVIKLCRLRPTLKELLLKTFEREEKIHFPTKLVETLSDYLFEKFTDDGKLREVGKRAIAKSIIVLSNVLKMMPVQLDEAYLNNLFDKMLSMTKSLYRLHLNHLKSPTPLHVHSSMMKYIFGILLSIASSVKHLSMKPDHYKSLSIWAMNESTKNKALPWLTIAELTKNKDDYDIFCKGLKENTQNKLLDVVIEAVLKPVKSCQAGMLDQKAIVIAMANVMDHEPLCAKDLISVTLVLDKLLASHNLGALAFIIRKMVQNDFPRTAELVIERELIRCFMNFEIATEADVKTYENVADLLETIIVCCNYEPLKAHVTEILINESSAIFMAMFIDAEGLDKNVFQKFNHNAFNLILVMMESEVGLRKICRALEEPAIANRMMFASHDNMRTSNPHNELVFQLRFWCSLLDVAVKHNSPVIDLISTHLLDFSSDRFIPNNQQKDGTKLSSKFGTVLDKKFDSIRFVIDLLFLQVVSIFEFIYSSKFSAEYKHDIKTLCFLIIKKLTATNTRAKEMAVEINLFWILSEKLQLSLMVMENNRHLETSKKMGVQKCQFMIKDLCIFLKALTEWQLPLDANTTILKDLFKRILKISDWLSADSVLMNCFLNLLQVVSVMEIGRSCTMEELEGKPLINTILRKTQAFSVKPPHTETNLVMMKSGISALKTCSHLVEVRMMLKNAKIYQMLEMLHPQIHKTRKTSWDEVTVEWLKFFEYLSRFEDSECLPNHVSLLCRIYGFGNSAIQKLSLAVIRNFSLKASIGFVLLNSDDFKQIVDVILTESDDTREKLLILETLLSIASKSERLISKLKNSTLNRVLKDQLRIMQSDAQFQTNSDNVKILHLTSMLSQLLYLEN